MECTATEFPCNGNNPPTWRVTVTSGSEDYVQAVRAVLEERWPGIHLCRLVSEQATWLFTTDELIKQDIVEELTFLTDASGKLIDQNGRLVISREET